jgi:phage regulator Rha-like protein
MNQKNALRTIDVRATACASYITLTLNESRGAPRVDSRIIARHLGAQRHQDTFELIKRYLNDFKELGIILFQTGIIKGRGKPEKYALLNEDQAYLLLTYSRNTQRVRSLKLSLVKAFRDARSRKAIHDAYLPGYHELHDEIALLTQRAKEAGSTTDEHIFHININKLVNKTVGIEAGTRGQLTALQKLMIANMQIVIRNAVHRAIQAGRNHKLAYAEARNAAEFFTSSAGQLLGEAV